MNLMAMHFNMDRGTFLNTSGLLDGAPQPGTEISTINAGYIIMVLSKMKEEFVNTPLEQMILDAVNTQSSFLIGNMQDANGGFYNGYSLSLGPDNTAKTAAAQAAAARGLYAAYALTGNDGYLTAADEAYNFLISNYYVADQHAFRTELNNDLATYTPFNFAVLTGGLREAALVGGHTEAASIYTRFFKEVANVMQLAEFDMTGETGNDSDGDGIPFLPEQPDQLAPVFAAEAQLNLIITGVNEIQANSELNVIVYPNPVSEKATIGFNIEKPSKVSVTAIDLTGKTIQTFADNQLHEGLNEITWDVSKLTKGIYFVRISIGDSRVINKKVIVM